MIRWPLSACGERPRVARLLVAPALALAVSCGPAVALEASNHDELVDEAVALGLPGIILLVDRPGDEDDFLAARGEADRSAGAPMTPDARFRIASNSKSFVGLAAAQLELEGLVQLDAPAAQWLPEPVVSRIENADAATLRQLLNHTAGTFDYLENDDFWAEVDRDPARAWTLLDAIAFAYDEPAEFAPGDGWAYSNTNYMLAGLALEGATGQTWGEVVRGRVLEPLALEASFIEGQTPATGAIVHGYSAADGDLRDMFSVNTGYGLPDGGVVSTAEDLSRFLRALATRAEPLRAASTLATSELVDAGDDRYGLGISRWPDIKGYEAWGHGGNLEGYASEMYYFPALETSIVVLVNGSDGELDATFDAVVDRALTLTLEGAG